MCDRCQAIDFEFAALISTKTDVTDPSEQPLLADDIAQLTREKEALQAMHRREASMSMLDYHLEAAFSYCEELDLEAAERLIEHVQQMVFSARK